MSLMYRRFIFISTILTLLAAAPFTLGGLLCPPVFQETFLGAYPEKCARLCHTEGKRLIFVGGSGIAFAIDSALAEEQFPGYQAVNMGLYADLGMKIPLDMVSDHLHAGDIVILAPEQAMDTLSLHVGASSAWQAFDGHWELLLHVRRQDLGTLLAALPGFSRKKWSYFISGDLPRGEGIYRRASFNHYGDIESDLADANHMPSLYDPDLPVLYATSTADEAFLRYLSGFYKKAARKGAEVYYAFCPVNRLALLDGDKTGQKPEDFYSYLEEKLPFPLLGNPNQSVLDEAWFFDTNFHLNQAGRTLYTRQLIRDLKAVKGITSPTGIPVPEKPEPLEWTGTVIRSDLYAGNESITRIQLPLDTIRIENYAFSGCKNLREIDLPGKSPSRIQVGEHLLDGTEAVLAVPEEALSAYRTDYRFSRFEGRIVGAGMKASEREKE